VLMNALQKEIQMRRNRTPTPRHIHAVIGGEVEVSLFIHMHEDIRDVLQVKIVVRTTPISSKKVLPSRWVL